MRILVYSSSVFKVPLNGYGGLEIIAWECAKGLALRGHQVALVAPDGSECPGVQIFPCGPERLTSEQSAWDKVWKSFLTFAPDVSIDHSWSKACLTLKREGRYKGPILNVCHAPVNTMFGSLPQDVNFNAVCISEDQKNHFEALFNRQARTCHNGVDIQFYQPLNIPRSDRYTFLARFSTIKGPLLAMEVAEKCGVGLDMIGDAAITAEPELYAECIKRADGKQIRIVGQMGRGNCVWWHSQSRGLLHPNKEFREPFGLSPVEAQLCGTAVCCWNNGAMRETVKHGETGYLVNSIEEMIDVVKSGVLDKIDRNKCREWAMRFSIEAMCKRYEELCFEALKKEW